ARCTGRHARPSRYICLLALFAQTVPLARLWLWDAPGHRITDKAYFAGALRGLADPGPAFVKQQTDRSRAPNNCSSDGDSRIGHLRCQCCGDKRRIWLRADMPAPRGISIREPHVWWRALGWSLNVSTWAFREPFS